MRNIEIVSVLVPAYNEENSLKELFTRTDRVMRDMGQSYEFIFINDGSNDGTLDAMLAIRGAHENVTIVTYARNHGKSMALMQGFEVARGDVFVVMDADLQDLPEDIPAFMEKIAEGYDIAGGRRTKRKDSFSKRLVSKVYNYLTSLLIGYPFNDINCGIKVFTRKTANLFELRGDMHRLMPAIAISFGMKFTEVDVSHESRKYGCSKYPLLRHRGILDLISFSVLRTTQTRPFHVISEVGFLFLGFAALLLLGYYLLGFATDGGVFGFIRSVVFVVAVWFGIIGTLCPFVGLVIESIASNYQTEQWRRSLLKEVLPAKSYDAQQ